MNDDHTEMTPKELDDLASAYLDGEATMQEVTLVSSDPRLQARVEQFRTIKTQMATPVKPPPSEVRDRMIAQALTHRTPVMALESTRRRRLTPRRVGVVLATAAVVAAITIVSLGVIQKNNSDTGDSFATETRIDPSTSATVLENAEIDEKPPENLDFFTQDSRGPVINSPESEEIATGDWESDDQGTMDEGTGMNAYHQPEEDQIGETMPTPGKVPQRFDTLTDLKTYAVWLANNYSHEQNDNMDEEIPIVSSTSCPLLLEEEPELELIARFTVLVEGTETEVSVYINNDLVVLTRTTPPPDCHNLDSVLKISLPT
ncbi:anti-sigma factor family protein [Candidatus Poriferisocius sp.]|uniref:anti-sigma factor family protein n=1 Tax=Candidatus Poriferisocius sp. TaxID=3101276 RepID=UPI003B024372